MKKLLLLFVCMFSLSVFAQIKMESNGKIKLGSIDYSANYPLMELQDKQFMMVRAPGDEAGILYYETGGINYNMLQYGAFTEYDEGSDLFKIGTFSDGKHLGLYLWRGNGHVTIGDYFYNHNWEYELTVNDDAKIKDKLEVGGFVTVGENIIVAGSSLVVGGEFVTSDEKVKTDIQDISQVDVLMKLQQIVGKKYKYKNKQEIHQLYNYTDDKFTVQDIERVDSSNVNNFVDEDIFIPAFPQGEHYGLIAQEVKDVFPEAVVYDSLTNLYGINYNAFIPILIESIKRQQGQIDTLKIENRQNKTAINGLSNTIDSLKNVLNALKPELEKSSDNFSISPLQNTVKSGSFTSGELAPSAKKIHLYQNTPNPFTENTKITYFIPESVDNAVIYLYDMNGTQLKGIQLHQKGNGSVTINGGEFKAGMYIYTLIADGQVIDTKQMILTD